MLSLSEAVAQTPVHVFYVGSETEFLDELDALEHGVADAERLEFTCCRDAPDLVAQLYAYDAARGPNVVVFGLLRHLEREGLATPEAVLRHWAAALSAGPGARFGDTAASALVDNLLSTKT